MRCEQVAVAAHAKRGTHPNEMLFNMVESRHHILSNDDCQDVEVSGNPKLRQNPAETNFAVLAVRQKTRQPNIYLVLYDECPGIPSHSEICMS